MKLLTEYAIKAFNEGSDNFGETVTGEVRDLEYSSITQNYTVTLILKEEDGRTSTAGIGFYPRDNKLDVCSGHIVFAIDKTPELEKELAKAYVTDF